MHGVPSHCDALCTILTFICCLAHVTICRREGRTHGESFEFDDQTAQLQSAVLDLTGEDQSGMAAQKRQYK
jgi:hypothetical protein